MKQRFISQTIISIRAGYLYVILKTFLLSLNMLLFLLKLKLNSVQTSCRRLLYLDNSNFTDYFKFFCVYMADRSHYLCEPNCGESPAVYLTKCVGDFYDTSLESVVCQFGNIR